MAWFRNLSLAKKLYGLVGVLLVLLVLVGVTSISSLSSVNQQGGAIYSTNAVALYQLGAANTAFTDEQRLVLRGIVYARDPAIQQQVDSAIAADQAAFQRELNQYTSAGLAPEESAGMATLRPAVVAYLPQRDRVRALAKAGDVTAASSVNGQAVGQFNTVQSSLVKLIAFNQAEAAQAAKGISSTYSSSRTQTIVLLALALLLGGAAAFFTVRQLSGSVKSVIERMAGLTKAFQDRLVPGLQALAGGDLTVAGGGHSAGFGFLK